MSLNNTVKDEDLFEINAAGKQAICKTCGKIITDLRKFSYQRHYRLVHRSLAIQLGILQEDDVQPTPRKIPKIDIRMDQQTYVGSMVELVTTNGLPLNVFRYPAFQRITRPIEEGLKINHLDPESMHSVLKNVAKQIRTLITNAMDGKMICLKIDTASRMDREFLGVNVQYPENKLIQIRTLNVLELKDRHTAENLTIEILAVLEPFGINLRCLLCVTTDNARNMYATVNRLKMYQELAINDFEAILSGDSNDQSLVDDGEGENNNDDDDDEDDGEETEGDDNDATLTGRTKFVEGILQGVRCAEHTLQLAVSDTLKTVKSSLTDIRSSVKRLRKQPYKKMFTMSKHRRPKLDCPTRWNSSYIMMQSLSKEKEFIVALNDNEEEPVISVKEWDFIETFLTVFKPVAEVTVKLQHSQVTFGDLFLLWEKCSFILKTMECDLAVTLLANMDKRRLMLMTNKVFLAAIFVDQRINFRNSPFITNEQREVAMDFLLQTWTNMRDLSGNTPASTSQQRENVANDAFEAFLQSLDEASDNKEESEIIDELNNLSRLPRLKLQTIDGNETILEWWFKSKATKPNLFSLVSTILAIPCTQVSVERTFSALPIILTKFRAQLKEETLNNILFIRLNSDLLKKVDFSKT